MILSKQSALTLCCLLLPVSCKDSIRVADEALLRDCWHATALEDGSYEFGFDAGVLVATESGTFARSRTCPNTTFEISRLAPMAEQQFLALQHQALRPSGGVGDYGIAAVAIGTVDKRDDDAEIPMVRISSFSSLRRLSDQEYRALKRQFGWD